MPTVRKPDRDGVRRANIGCFRLEVPYDGNISVISGYGFSMVLKQNNGQLDVRLYHSKQIKPQVLTTERSDYGNPTRDALTGNATTAMEPVTTLPTIQEMTLNDIIKQEASRLSMIGGR